MNRRMSTKHLQQLLRQYRKKLAQKELVLGRHEPGMSYHTRAAREAEGYRSRISEFERELARRKA